MAIRIIGPAAPTVSQGEDVARSAQTGGVEGASQFLGTIGDLQNIGGAAAQKVAGFLKEHGFGDGSVPQGIPGIPTIPQAFQALSTAVAKKTGADPRLSRLATAAMMPAAIGQAPTSAEIQGAVTKDGPLYQPQTKAGQYARTIAQFAPAAATPGSAARRLANVIAPALASETAGQITKGTKAEPYARIAGALAGGGGAAILAAPGPRTRILAEAVRGASDDQIAQARQLMETGQREGVQLTMAEALQQVTNGGTGMGRLQRVVEGTKAGAERISPVMAQRPGQVRQAVTGFADTLAPATDQPSMIGAQAQQAAEGGLGDVRRFVNFGAQPHYEALVGQALPDAEFQHLRQNPTFAAALGELRSNPELNASIAHLPDNDLSVINEVQKRIQGMAEAATPNPANPAGNNQLAAVRNSAAGQVNDIASQASPDWRAARDAVSAGRQEYLEPLQRGPLGAISATPDVGTQTSALFPTRPLEGAPAETARAIEMLGSQDPAAGPSLVRQHLVNDLNEATQANVGGPNQWGGAKYAALVAGNPEQERTLMSGVGAAGGDTGRLADIVNVLRGTGWRERPGSMTAYNTKDLEELGNAGMLGEVARTGLNPPGTFRRIGAALQDWQTERNAGRLADAILAAPADAEAIVQRARQVVPEGQALRTIEQLGIAAQQSRRPQLENQ